MANKLRYKSVSNLIDSLKITKHIKITKEVNGLNNKKYRTLKK